MPCSTLPLQRLTAKKQGSMSEVSAVLSNGRRRKTSRTQSMESS